MMTNTDTPLTEKQNEIFQYIKKYIEEKSHGPTQKEIQEEFDLKSLGSIQVYLNVLSEKGYILKGSSRWNHIELTQKRNVLQVMGKVAAGRPIKHLKYDESIEIPVAMLSPTGRHYALQVLGDSMVNEGILDDDYIVVRQQKAAENGQIVIAMIEEEVTLKKYYKLSDRIELRSANEKYKPIVVKDTNSFQILGVFCGLIRMAQ